MMMMVMMKIIISINIISHYYYYYYYYYYDYFCYLLLLLVQFKSRSFCSIFSKLLPIPKVRYLGFWSERNDFSVIIINMSGEI